MAPVADRNETTLYSHGDTPARRGPLNVSRRHGEAMSPLVSRAIERARSGDRDALGLLYVRYADDVYEYVRTVVVVTDEAWARAVTQRVFAELEFLIDRYEERDAPF